MATYFCYFASYFTNVVQHVFTGSIYITKIHLNEKQRKFQVPDNQQGDYWQD